MHGGCGLQGIRSSQAMPSANPGRKIGDLQVRGNPIQVGVGGKQAIDVICPLFIAYSIRQHQQFRHRNCGCDRHGFRSLKPGKNTVGVRKILGVGL